MSVTGLGFDTGLEVDLGAGNAIDHDTTGITIAGWIFRTGVASEGWNNTLNTYFMSIGNTSGSNNGSLIINPCNGAADRMEVRAQEDGSTTNYRSTHNFTAGAYDNTWVPVILTFNTSDVVQCYIEDSTKNDATPATAANISGDFRYVHIGTSPSGSNAGGTVTGDHISDVAIWDKVLSSSEIDQIQTSAETGVELNTIATANCVAYWTLRGSTFAEGKVDQTGNGHTLIDSGTAFSFIADGGENPTIVSSGTNETVYPFTGPWR